MIIHRNLSKSKNKMLPICIQGTSRGSLGKFNNTSYGVFAIERVKAVGEKTVGFYKFAKYEPSFQDDSFK